MDDFRSINDPDHSGPASDVHPDDRAELARRIAECSFPSAEDEYFASQILQPLPEPLPALHPAIRVAATFTLTAGVLSVLYVILAH